jgi:hypothetical protein
MRILLGTAVAALLLVGCGDSGGDFPDAEGCQLFFDLKARLKPSGFNFDENNDGYMNAGEQLNQVLNNNAINLYESTKDSYADC